MSSKVRQASFSKARVKEKARRVKAKGKAAQKLVTKTRISQRALALELQPPRDLLQVLVVGSLRVIEVKGRAKARALDEVAMVQEAKVTGQKETRVAKEAARARVQKMEKAENRRAV